MDGSPGLGRCYLVLSVPGSSLSRHLEVDPGNEVGEVGLPLYISFQTPVPGSPFAVSVSSFPFPVPCISSIRFGLVMSNFDRDKRHSFRF